MNVTYYVASSLDGFIARPDGDVSWLDTLNIDQTNTGYEQFYATVDGIVMGRNTYDFIVKHGAWPYQDKPTWVCSQREFDAMEGCNLQPGRSVSDTLTQARALNIQHLWLVGGGLLAASFIRQQALTHLSISQMPIVLGRGLPLFGDLENTVALRPQHAPNRDAGFTQLDYCIDYATEAKPPRT